jgi:hypothetical protein
MTTSLRTFDRLHDDCNAAGQPCSYFGERGDWLCVMARCRDSGCLKVSNFETARKRLEAIDPGAVAVESETHWAVGWVETLLVNPDSPQAVAEAERIRESLEDYPVLDEDDLSDREYEAAATVWRDVFNVRDRIEYLREYNHYGNFRQLLAAVRGDSHAACSSMEDGWNLLAE